MTIVNYFENDNTRPMPEQVEDGLVMRTNVTGHLDAYVRKIDPNSMQILPENGTRQQPAFQKTYKFTLDGGDFARSYLHGPEPQEQEGKLDTLVRSVAFVCSVLRNEATGEIQISFGSAAFMSLSILFSARHLFEPQGSQDWTVLDVYVIPSCSHHLIAGLMDDSMGCMDAWKLNGLPPGVYPATVHYVEEIEYDEESEMHFDDTAGPYLWEGPLDFCVLELATPVTQSIRVLSFPSASDCGGELYDVPITVVGFPGRAKDQANAVDGLFSRRFRRYVDGCCSKESALEKSVIRSIYQSSFFDFKYFVACFGIIKSLSKNTRDVCCSYFFATMSGTPGLSGAPLVALNGTEAVFRGCAIGALDGQDLFFFVTATHPSVRKAHADYVTRGAQ